MKTEDIDYQDGDLKLSGYLAYDETIAGERPGVLLVHDAGGLGRHMIERAKMLVSLGYVAFAADMYGDRKQATDMASAFELMGDMRTNPPKIRGRGRAALDTLASLPQVDPKKLAAIGYCFGGTTVLELARSGADIAGVVSFHGGLETAAPAVSGEVKASVLVCTGADDPIVPPSQINSFEEEMTKAGADWQVIVYGGTVHSFTDPKADGSIAPSIKYNKSADERSWAAMRRFFDEIFALSGKKVSALKTA